MKVAMWGVGLAVLSLLGIVVVNLFGNITVTDQLNYTSMKNAVEASMYDSLDVQYYRKGFCLCTNKQKGNDDSWHFNGKDNNNVKDYELSDIVYDNDGNEKCESKTMSNCEILHGEYRINPQTFSESLIRRFAEMVNNNKDYTVIIQDIIEYPPKVSVRIDSKDKEYSPTENGSGGYTIVNQMDGIIETKKGAPASTIAPTPGNDSSPTPAPTSTPTSTPGNACYRKDDTKKEYNGKKYYENYKWMEEKKHDGYSKVKGISKESDCKNYCYKNKETNKYYWGLPKDYDDSKYEKQSKITKIDDCKAPSSSSGGYNDNCKWHHPATTVTCKKINSGETFTKRVASAGGYTSCGSAFTSCVAAANCGADGGVYYSGCSGVKTYSAMQTITSPQTTITRSCSGNYEPGPPSCAGWYSCLCRG